MAKLDRKPRRNIQYKDLCKTLDLLSGLRTLPLTFVMQRLPSPITII